MVRHPKMWLRHPNIIINNNNVISIGRKSALTTDFILGNILIRSEKKYSTAKKSVGAPTLQTEKKNINISITVYATKCLNRL